MLTHSKAVCVGQDFEAVMDIADEVSRLYGHNITIVCFGGPRHGSDLYINTQFPTWEAAHRYARELYEAAKVSREEYLATVRR